MRQHLDPQGPIQLWLDPVARDGRRAFSSVRKLCAIRPSASRRRQDFSRAATKGCGGDTPRKAPPRSLPDAWSDRFVTPDLQLLRLIELVTVGEAVEKVEHVEVAS